MTMSFVVYDEQSLLNTDNNVVAHWNSDGSIGIYVTHQDENGEDCLTYELSYRKSAENALMILCDSVTLSLSEIKEILSCYIYDGQDATREEPLEGCVYADVTIIDERAIITINTSCKDTLGEVCLLIEELQKIYNACVTNSYETYNKQYIRKNENE